MCLESKGNGLHVLERKGRGKLGGVRSSRGILYKEYFSNRELESLCGYRNRGSDQSLTYRYVLSPFYDVAIRLVPMWLAPNVVTLIGLMCVLASHLLAMVYVPHLTEDAPRWVYFLLWVGLFSYMTLDNLDGRQARRTGTSSPLGHLFDHGCDTLNVFITGLNTAAALRLGSNVRALLLVWGAGMALFFSATLEEYYNGALNLGFINGPNEGLLIMQIIYLVSAIFGSNVWTQEFAVGSYQFPVGNIFLYVLVPLATPTFIANYVSIFTGGWRKGDKKRLYRAIKTSTPFFIFSASIFTWQQTSSALELYPYLFLWCIGLNFFYIISRLIVAHLTHSHYPPLTGMAIPMVLGALNALGGHLVGSSTGFFDQKLVLWFLLTVQTAVDSRRVWSMTRQICHKLNIRCFHIAPLTKPN